MDNGITPLTPTEVTAAEAKAAKESYLVRVLVAFDIFVNVLCNGRPDETISSHAARAATEGKWWGVILSQCLDVFQSDHGAKAEAGDVERADAVIQLEDKSGDL